MMMGIFSSKTSDPAPKPVDPDHLAFERFKAIVKSREHEVYEANPANMEKCQADWIKDRADFGYRFARHGDFLTISTSRHGVKQAKTINLGLVKSISIKEGYAPDYSGEVGWLVNGTGFYFAMDYSHPFVGFSCAMDDFDNGNAEITFTDSSFYIESGARFLLTTNGTASCASDDVINFNGLEDGVHVPHGMANQVHDALMAELARGALPVSF